MLKRVLLIWIVVAGGPALGASDDGMESLRTFGMRKAYKCTAIAALSYARQQGEPAASVARAAFSACKTEWNAVADVQMMIAKNKQQALDLEFIKTTIRKQALESFEDNVIQWRARAALIGDEAYEDVARRLADNF